jgi:hypothetical protein
MELNLDLNCTNFKFFGKMSKIKGFKNRKNHPQDHIGLEVPSKITKI